MKKILLGLIIGLFVVFVINSCEKEDPKPDCEINNYGAVTVKNTTGHSLWVDVTWGDVVINYEKKLTNGGSYKYNEIPAGSIEIWASFDGNNWYYEDENLSACEDMTFTWYLNSLKSTEKSLVLRNDITGEEFYPIFKEKR